MNVNENENYNGVCPTPKSYIGVKRVEAVPMTAGEAVDEGYRVGQNGSVIPPTTQGYEVIY